MTKSTIISLVGKADNRILSLGSVRLFSNGTFYHHYGIGDMHMSIHKDGKTHARSRKIVEPKGSEVPFNQDIPLGKLGPLKEITGLKMIGTRNIGVPIETLKEYKPRKFDALVSIDLDSFDVKSLGICVGVLSDEGIPLLFDMLKKYKQTQLFILGTSSPKIVIIIFDSMKTINAARKITK